MTKDCRRLPHFGTLLALALAGCVTSEPVSYLTLEAPDQDITRRDAATVSLGPIALPDYLKRSSLARRDAAGALHYSMTELWAEPLDGAIQRTLVATLSDALGDTPVLVFPGLSATRARYGIRVSLRRLEVTDSRVAMQASWHILAAPSSAAEQVNAGRFNAQRSLASPSGPAVARAISELVRDLGLEIAAALPPRES